MCHFLAPAGQPEMMHKNFMHRHLRIFVVQRSCMKFYASVIVYRVDFPCSARLTATRA